MIEWIIVPVLCIQSLDDLIKEEADEEGRSKCKFILVSIMKEDDPVAWKSIPEFILLAAKYGRSGEFAVILSNVERFGLASEYAGRYGFNATRQQF